MKLMKLALAAVILAGSAAPAMAAYDYKKYLNDQHDYYTSSAAPLLPLQIGNVGSAWDWQYRDRLKTDGFHCYYRTDNTSNYAGNRVLAGRVFKDMPVVRTQLAGKVLLRTF